MARLIVVLGVTGTQGSSVADTFLSLSDWKVRGVTRNPSSPVAQALTAKGVDIVKADLDETSSLVAAFQGAHAVFAVTDFWAPVFSTSGQEAAKAAGKTINQYAYDIELQQGKNIADAASETSVMKTLERFVYSSLAHVKKWSGGKYRNVYHFDSKAAVVEYVREQKKGLAEIMSTVQIGEYSDNWKKYPALAPKKQADGSFLLAKPHSGEAKIPMVVAGKDTGVFVQALVENPPGINLLGYGSLIGWAEYMRIWSSIVGAKGAFKQVTKSEYLPEMPETLAQEIAEGHAFHAEFGWDGGDPDIVNPKDLKIEGRTTSIEKYIRDEDWSSILKA